MKNTSQQNFPISSLTSPKELTISHLPRKIPSRYLARTFRLNQDEGMRQKQINLKRIHIRNLIEAEKADNEDDNEEAKQLSIKHKICHKKKLFKGLAYVEISSFFHLHWIEELKHCKNIVYFRCDPYNNSPQENIIRCFQKLHKNLEDVNVNMNFALNMNSFLVKKLSKAVGKLHNLKRYGGYRALDVNEESFAKSEFLYLNKNLRRLPKLKTFECEIVEFKLEGLRNIMGDTKMYEKVTKLSMNLCLGPFGDEEDHEQVLPFFHFQTFPNLQELNICASIPGNDAMDYQPCYGDFVVEGFKKLAHLEKLTLQLTFLSSGLNFIFEGLEHLPQLSSFSFYIDSLELLENWDLLALFIENQNNLVWLDFNVEKLNTFQQKQVLENFIASLSHKPRLQYLKLTSDLWPLQTLSDGFNRVTGSDQIKSNTSSFEPKTSFLAALETFSLLFKASASFYFETKIPFLSFRSIFLHSESQNLISISPQ